MISRTLAASTLAVLAAACSTDPVAPAPSAGPAVSQGAAAEGGPEFVPGEVLVKFRPGASASARGAAMRAANAQAADHIVTGAMRRAGDGEGITVLRTPMAVQAAVQSLRASGAVEYAEPNWVYHHAASVSNDTYFVNNQLWGMYGPATSPANQYGSNAAAAWAAGAIGSKSVFVGIIDEGIQFDHPDLAGQVWTNPAEVVNGVDDDGNGYVDDVRGWDFDANDNTIYDGGTRGALDDHGTHVAGTIGGRGGNGTGVVGVNWDVTLIAGKFLGRRGGTTASAVRAVDYFTDLRTNRRVNVVATNNSWGGGGYSQALYDAINRANAAGILFVAAAGNGGSDGVGDNNDQVASYPSNYDLPNVIAVAAITSTGARSSFSNYGAQTVDIGAPGSGVFSTTAYNGYSSYNGTSMATPHVTGAVALYAAANPGATAAEIKNAILSSAVPTASLDGKTTTGGRLDVKAALAR
jgi:subtilisin family serine protease